MNFEQRTEIAVKDLSDFLGRFTPPKGLGPDRQDQIILSISDAFARRLPASSEEEYREALRANFTKVADNHKSYAWPPQGLFVDNMVAPVPRTSAVRDAFEPARDEILAKKFEFGWGVPERYLWNGVGERLATSGSIDRQALEDHRRQSVKVWGKVYRQFAADLMAKEYGYVVTQYFSREAAE